VAELMVQTASIYLPNDSLSIDLQRDIEELEEMIEDAERAFYDMGSYDF
jgi:hypothetical protein